YAKAHNNLAWLQVSYPEVPQREPGEAVRLAKAAVAMEPEMREFWNTLGVAYYRAGEWTPATEALEKSMQLKDGGGGDAHDWLFLAMIRWRLGDKEQARRWFDRSIGWIQGNKSTLWTLGELTRFRLEAAELMGLDDPPRCTDALQES